MKLDAFPHACSVLLDLFLALELADKDAWPEDIFLKYCPVLSVLPTNVSALTLVFATGECGSEKWAGVDGRALAVANVPLFTAANVNYVISTGGACGGIQTRYR
ncbi:hypothetical protein [Burkholderia stagnalis]